MEEDVRDNRELHIGNWEIEATDNGGEFGPGLGKQFTIKLHNALENRTFMQSVAFIKPYTDETFLGFMETLTEQFEHLLKREKEM